MDLKVLLVVGGEELCARPPDVVWYRGSVAIETTRMNPDKLNRNRTDSDIQ